jgi:uncharacterized membrane protein
MDVDAGTIDPIQAPDESELTNNIVTVTRLQVALRAEAKTVQDNLSELTIAGDTTTPAGLFQLLQQAAILLLDQADQWTHVLASSQTVDSREAAEALFAQLSTQEQSKFSAETLSNVDGVLHQESLPPTDSSEKPAYIVVTVLLGTADDRPLFGDITTATALWEALQQIVALRSHYLMVLELLWTPQTARESLTATELVTEYADLAPLEHQC